MKNSISVIVLFEEPFWIGIIEKTSIKGYVAAKVTFGPSEPTNNVIYDFLLNKADSLKFSAPKCVDRQNRVIKNPKRLIRAAQKQLQNTKIISKAHNAIKAMQELSATQNKLQTKQQAKVIQEKKYTIKKAKKKQKHRGH